MCDCRTCQDEIFAEIRQEIQTSPRCMSCGRIVNCADCADRRRRIDAYAAQPPRGPIAPARPSRLDWVAEVLGSPPRFQRCFP